MPQVTIYSTHSCQYCQALKEWLDKNNVEHEDKFVDENEANMEEMMKVSDSHMGVPFSVIKTDDGQEVKVAGFDRTKFKEVLGIQ